MKSLFKYLLFLVALLFIVLPNIFFITTEWQRAIRFQFGEVQEVYEDAGIHFKWPFVQNVLKYDAKLQTLETQPERFLTDEKKNLMVDTFVKWRIKDTATYYKAVDGNIGRANLRLEQIIKGGLRSEFAKKSLQDVVGGVDEKGVTTRSSIQNTILEIVYEEGLKLGVEVVDLRLKKVELPDDVVDSVYKRMRTERERIAKELRSKGESAYIEIRANADRDRTIMLADAYKKAEIIRGEADAAAAKIYADAYQKNTNFYQFFRSMQAYKTAFSEDSNGIMLLSPDSDFLKYFKQSTQ